LSFADLNGGSRPHMLEFSKPVDTAKTTIATAANLQLSGVCDRAGGGSPKLSLFLKNVTNQTGTMNVMFTSQGSGNVSPSLYSSAQFVGAGDEFTVDSNDDIVARGIAGGFFDRVEGQLDFQTPGRVTTIDFHAFTGDPGNPRCEFYGTAVTSNLS